MPKSVLSTTTASTASTVLGAVKWRARDIVHKLRSRLQFQQQKLHFRRLFREKTMGDAFAEIYRTNSWGSIEGSEFFSGDGSREEFAAPYTKWVNDFVKKCGLRHIVDLGCGDFRVGKLLDTSMAMYTGVDVAPNVVRYNTEHFGKPGVEFRCLNIIENGLPQGDMALIRQVLQHLSNNQVSQVLRNCSKYPYVVVTEDVYAGKDARPNLDKEAGWDTRLLHKSGIFVDLPPFNYGVRVVMEIPYAGTNLLRTVLIENKA
jgi:SAM-dependent methyltransferase